MAVTLLLGACGGDDTVAPDAPAVDVLAAMQARATWMEDFIWGADAYKQCTGCQHLTVLEFQADRYQLHVFMRSPGQPTTAVEQCTSTMMFTHEAVNGFATSDRVALTITVGTNTCGYAVGSQTRSVWQRVSSDSAGANYIAGWDNPSDTAGAFPGYSSTGGSAYPMRPCATAPGTLCEPACDLALAPSCSVPEP